jgi:rod shape-determining protein MreC
VRAGDRVLSTGDGGLLPPDLQVGTVIDDGGTLRVALFANPDLSDYVHVLSYDGAVTPPSAENDPPVGARPPATPSTAPVAKPASTPRPQAAITGTPASLGGSAAPSAPEYDEEDR